jgi:hypothetical protein
VPVAEPSAPHNGRAILLHNLGAGEKRLMSLFGHPLSTVLVLQLVTTGIVLGLYAISVAMHEDKADHDSMRNMTLLTAFLFRHHPTVTSLAELMESTETKSETAKSDRIHFFQFLNKFLATGEFPSFPPSSDGFMLSALFAVMSAPINALTIAPGSGRDHGDRFYRVTHTVYRKSAVSSVMVLLFINLFFAFVVVEVLLPRHPIIGGIGLVYAVFDIVACLVSFWALVKEQRLWKDYWSERLLEVMAHAAFEQDHDVFNRALFLKNDVESQPELPIPGKLSIYTTVYSVIQALILYSSKILHFS